MRQPHPNPQIELVEGGLQVALHRDLPGGQPLRDLGIGEAERDEPDDLTLAGGDCRGTGAAL
jgi:hypothetical protein